MKDDRVMEILELLMQGQRETIGLLTDIIEAIRDANHRVGAVEQRLAELEKQGQQERPPQRS
jgi:hypothetical protein